MAKFLWTQLPGLQPPLCCLVFELSGATQYVKISGVFDTGASITYLRTPVEQPRLGVPDSACIPSPSLNSDGNTSWYKVTMLRAHLDGHDFDLPVAFSDVVPMNVIGRAGFIDLWEIRNYPPNSTTQFDWLGPRAGTKPWADEWVTYVKAMLQLNYNWTNWNLHGRPSFPSAPELPANPLP